MAVDINSIVVESSKAFAARFNAGIGSAKPDYTQVATVLKSTTGATAYGWLGDFPRLKQWVSERRSEERRVGKEC